MLDTVVKIFVVVWALELCLVCLCYVVRVAIRCPLWSLVLRVPDSGVCVHISGGMFVMYCMQCCMSVSAVL